jgi:hypothetical protein
MHKTPPHTFPLTLGVAIEATADLPARSLHDIAKVARGDPRWTAVERLVALPISTLYRDANDARSPTYVVAERRHDGRLTMLTAWVIPDAAGRLRLRARTVIETHEEPKELRIAVPLAALHLSGQAFWILQQLGYEDERWIIAEIRPTAVRHVLEVDGGGC